MRIAIIGVGAMGSVYAALLADNGKHDVVAVDSWQAHVDAINAKGLRVEGASGDRTVRLTATTDAKSVKDADLVIIATKDDGVTEAAKSALAIAKPNAPILTIQNGLGSADKVAEIVGSWSVVQMGRAGALGAAEGAYPGAGIAESELEIEIEDAGIGAQWKINLITAEGIEIDYIVDAASAGNPGFRFAMAPVTFATGDFNRDGFVNGDDLGFLLGSWGACPTP